MTSIQADRSTPSIPASSAIAKCHAKTTISAPNTSASSVLSILLDTSTWPSWNIFVPSVKFLSQPTSAPSPSTLVVGSRVDFTVHMTPDNPKNKGVGTTTLRVSMLEPVGSVTPGVGKVLWESDQGWMMPRFLLFAERIHVIRDLEGGGVEVETWENLMGPLAYVVKWLYGDTLQRRFEDWVSGLKGFVEREGAGAGAS